MRYRRDLRLREAAERRSGRENGGQADAMARCFKHGSTSAPGLRRGCQHGCGAAEAGKDGQKLWLTFRGKCRNKQGSDGTNRKKKCICVIRTLSHDTHLTGGAGRPRDGFLTQFGSGDWDQPAAAAAVSRQPMKLRLKLLLNNTDLQATEMERWEGCVTGWEEGGAEREGISPAPSSGLTEELPSAAAAAAAAADPVLSSVPVSTSGLRGASRLLL